MTADLDHRRVYTGRMARLNTRLVHSRDDVVRHFDALAPLYAEAHGSAGRLLAYRLGVIRPLLAAAPRGTLLEIGCGTAIHLLDLADGFERAVGTDVSPAMVEAARELAAKARPDAAISLRVDPAEELGTVDDASVDAVLCVGSLEHMPDKGRVLHQVRRVLTPGGRFVCLTPNGGYLWYRHLAPMLGQAVRHLSTDRFVTRAEFAALLGTAGLTPVAHRYWTFVPRGDMPTPAGHALSTLDYLGRGTGWGYLRGGIAVAAVTGSPSSNRTR
jgi:2-polyprenyl-6-hydroxyphenyl methylase/3-demethylubiquinone-9 3-methyltransferase